LSLLQDVPSARGVLTHPIAVSQLSSVQGFPSSQLMAVPPQTPVRHESASVHALPSLHTVPSASSAVVHSSATQPSMVQGFASLQFGPVVPPQTPD
jgi:hypothetical protein